MIKLTSNVLLLCAIAISSLAQTPGSFTINGTLKNMTVPHQKVYLYIEHKLTDSTLINNSQYHFKGQLDHITDMAITWEILKKGEMLVYDMANIYVDKGEFNIVSDVKLDNFTVSGSGSLVTRDYKRAIKNTTRIGDSLKKVATLPEFKTDKKMQFDWRISMSNMFKPMNDEMVSFLKAHPATPAGVILMGAVSAMPYNSPDLIDSLLGTLPDAIQAQVKAKTLVITEKRRADERAKNEKEMLTAIGTRAKDFTMNNTEGKPVSLSSFKGKYVLVDFWASWCGPCRGENPNVVKTYNQYKGKGFNILGVSLDGSTTKAAWLKAIQTDGLSWTQVSDLKGWGNEAAKTYGVSAIPQNFLIDPNGIIIAKNLRGEELQKKLATLFK